MESNEASVDSVVSGDLVKRTRVSMPEYLYKFHKRSDEPLHVTIRRMLEQAYVDAHGSLPGDMVVTPFPDPDTPLSVGRRRNITPAEGVHLETQILSHPTLSRGGRIKKNSLRRWVHRRNEPRFAKSTTDRVVNRMIENGKLVIEVDTDNRGKQPATYEFVRKGDVDHGNRTVFYRRYD